MSSSTVLETMDRPSSHRVISFDSDRPGARARRRAVVLLVPGLVLLLLPGRALSPAAEGTTRWHLDDGTEAVTHRKAAKRCDRLGVAGRSDWRLPTVNDLRDLAARSMAGDTEAEGILAAVGGDAVWSGDVSPGGLAWAATFAHGYFFRIHETNEYGLRALCVAGGEPGKSPDGSVAVDEGSWMRPLDSDSDLALLWPCTGAEGKPELVQGSLRSFRRALPPGPLRDTVRVDFVIDADGRARFVAPAVGTPDRFGRLAVDTLETFRYDPATCDGRPIPVFYHLDFGG